MAVTPNPLQLRAGVSDSILITQPTDCPGQPSSFALHAPSPTTQGPDNWALTLKITAGQLADTNTVYTSCGQMYNNYWTLTDNANPGGTSTGTSSLSLTAEQCSAATLTCTYNGQPAGFNQIGIMGINSGGTGDVSINMVQGAKNESLAPTYLTPDGNGHYTMFNPSELPTVNVWVTGLSDGLNSDTLRMHTPLTADWQFVVTGFSGANGTSWTGTVYDPSNPVGTGWSNNDNPEWLHLSFAHYTRVAITVNNISPQFTGCVSDLKEVGLDPNDASKYVATFRVTNTTVNPTTSVAVKITIECGSGGE